MPHVESLPSVRSTNNKYTLTFSTTTRTLPNSKATAAATLLTEAITSLNNLIEDHAETKKVLAALLKDLKEAGVIL